MKIGVVGTGNMGRSLGVAWAHVGHQVFFGARNFDKATTAAELAGSRGIAGSNDEAAELGEVIIWNPRIETCEGILTSAKALDGKVVIDMHNGPVPADLNLQPIRSRFASHKRHCRIADCKRIPYVSGAGAKRIDRTGSNFEMQSAAIRHDQSHLK